MRLGVVLAPERKLEAIIRRVGVAEDLGFDVVWLTEGPDEFASPLAIAAALASHTSALRIVASVEAGPHPLYLAEDAIVADQALNGRLVLVIGHDDPGLLRETADVLLASFASRPFAHQGTRWTIPAHLPGHEGVERRIRVTPTPAQLELPLWLAGAQGAPIATELGLSHVSGPGTPLEAAAAAWQATVDRLGPAAARLRRPAVRIVEDPDDADGLVAALREEQRAWGLDVAVLAFPRLEDRGYDRGLRTIATAVRPRVQLDELPYGLEDYWARRAANQPLG